MSSALVVRLYSGLGITSKILDSYGDAGQLDISPRYLSYTSPLCYGGVARQVAMQVAMDTKFYALKWLLWIKLF